MQVLTSWALDADVEEASSSRVLKADRYGGSGIGSHGGSARCGHWLDTQVKGIGLTPLFGRSADEPMSLWHSDGELELVDAMREAIWSRIASAVLPAGAVNALAVIDLGKPCLGAHKSSGGKRALLVRELAVRPAHFLRNQRFDYAPGQRQVKATDLERVRAAAQALIEHLMSSSPHDERHVAARCMNFGLLLCARYASQAASAFSKRMFHRGLSPSNLALDGRFIDFGTTTSVPAFRRVAGAPSPGGLDQWNQQAEFPSIVSSLVQQVLAYSRPGIRIDRQKFFDQASWVTAQQMELELGIAFAGLAGVPRAAASALPMPIRRDFLRCARSIFQAGARARLTIREGRDPEQKDLEPMTSHGRFDFSTVLRRASEEGVKTWSSRPPDVLADSSYAADFARSYQGLLDAYLDRFSMAERPARLRRLREESIRQNAGLQELERANLDARLRLEIRETRSLQLFADTLIARSVYIMRDAEEV